MATPFTLQSAFIGMRQDEARDLLPGSALWNSVDWVPQYLGSPLRKRGGWAYASPAIGGGAGIANGVDALCYAPFATGEKFVAVGGDGNAYTYTSGSVSASLGSVLVAPPTTAVLQNPVYAITTVAGVPTGTVIFPVTGGATVPRSYDGTTFGALGGTPPLGQYAAIWNSRLLLANGKSTIGGTLFPNRLWFGPAGNAAGTWDVTNAWEDTQTDIVGLGVLKTAILCFHNKYTERIRGTTPPSATAIGDLVQDTAFQVGCVDARSIVNYNDTLIWADVRGVYQSDGAAIKDLTGSGGMRSYWRTLLYNYGAGARVSAGVLNDTLIISVYPAGGISADVFVYDLTRGFWYRFSNFPVRTFAKVGSIYEELHMGLMAGSGSGRVALTSTIFTPSATYKNDGDGTAVQPYFETGYFRGFTRLHRRWIPSMALQDWKNLFFNYDMRDAASDNPVMTVSYATDPGATSYTALTRTLAETTKYTRARRDLGFNSSGIMLKVAQTNASSDTRMSGFEAEYSPRESSRLAQ